jgi:hypothetical protein
MSRDDDHGHDMSGPPSPLLDDDTIEALLAGDDVPTSAQHLAVFVGDVRTAGERAAPRPSHRLADLLAGHDVEPLPSLAADPTEPIATLPGPRHARPSHRPGRRRSLAARVAGASLVAKIGLGATVAAAGVLGAGALDVVPGAPGDGLRKVVEAVTPLHSDDSDAPRRGAGGRDGEPGNGDGTAGEHGDRVSSDATGESDGEPGVDGPSVAESTPGADNRPPDAGPPEGDDPAGSGSQGVGPEGDPPADQRGQSGGQQEQGAGPASGPGSPTASDP